jgi:hypothetical protein
MPPPSRRCSHVSVKVGYFCHAGCFVVGPWIRMLSLLANKRREPWDPRVEIDSISVGRIMGGLRGGSGPMLRLATSWWSLQPPKVHALCIYKQIMTCTCGTKLFVPKSLCSCLFPRKSVLLMVLVIKNMVKLLSIRPPTLSLCSSSSKG